MRVGLALGGGGARGLAHLGVLTALTQAGITIEAVAGTSFGALVGALYATTKDPKITCERVLAFLRSPGFRRVSATVHRSRRGIALTRPGLMTEQDYLRLIASVVDENTIEALAVPFAAVATDLVNGREVVLRAGSIRRAVAASSALPSVFPPIHVNGRLLVDGGWVNVVPVEAARALGADVVIAVHTAERMGRRPPLRNGLDVLRRANDITRSLLSRHQLAGVDLVIQPDVGEVTWSEFGRAADCIARGKEAARRIFPVLAARLKTGDLSPRSLRQRARR